MTACSHTPVQRSKHNGKPNEGIWSLMKRSMANFAAADQANLVRIIKRKLKKDARVYRRRT